VSLRLRAAIVLALLVAGFFQAAQMTRFGEESSLGGKIIHTVASPYQRIAVTSKRGGFQLYLNGHLQFNSTDEYRYHEALVHPALLGIDQPKKILVLGGGDGLAVREILRYPSIQRVVLVDLDPAMTDLSKSFPPLVALNRSSLQDPRVEVINQDAFLWINQSSELFDAVIIDFPDPGSFSIGKLYTTHFFRKLKDRISANTLVSIQCTSPLVAPQSYWCIVRTLEAAGFVVKPFHASVPSFGVWGYALASLSDIQIDAKRLAPDGQLRFLNSKNLADLFTLPQDIRPQTPQINRLDNQSLVRYYDEEWHGID
jgi:spermidine synthase